MYSIDTSALLDGLERFYPEDHFPGLWTRIEELVVAGRLVCSEEVYEEAKKRDARALAWCEKYTARDLLVPTDNAIAGEVRTILAAYPRLAMRGRGHADPFVIAVARIRNWAVVTGENPGSERTPKIPYVCAQLKVPCFRLIDLIRQEGWRFD